MHPIMLSVVVPFRNFDNSAREMLSAVIGAVEGLVEDFEIIVVDNGSTRAQFGQYHELVTSKDVRNVQVYRLLQEVEFELAAVAGIENSLGDYVLVFDPRSENLSQLATALEKVAGNCEVVFLRNLASTDHGLVQRLAGSLFRSAFRRLTGIDLTLDAANGRLISKRVVTYLLAQPQPAAQYRTLPVRAGFACETVTYQDEAAVGVRPGLLPKVRSAMRLVVANSMAPIRLVSLFSIFGALANVAYSAYVVVIALIKENVAPGWVTLSLQQSGMFLLITLILFVLTEYLIQALRWNMKAGDYFIDAEMTSVELTRHHKLNVDRAEK